MKLKPIIFVFILTTLWSCASSKKFTKLQNQVEELENTLSDEIQKNRVLSSLRFLIASDPCIKGANPNKKSPKIIVIDDSLCMKHNNLLDKHYNLTVSYFIQSKDFNSNFVKSDSIISRLRTEYKGIKKSSK